MARNAVLILIGTEVVMNGRAWLLPVPAFLLPKSRPPLVFLADFPGGAITHILASVSGFVSEELVTKLRIISVSVKQSVSPVRFPQFSRACRVLQPAIMRSSGQLQHPQ